MEVAENPQYSADYLDPGKRAIANAVQVFFKDGSATQQVEIEYPIGHRMRRDEGIPLLVEKFKKNVSTRFQPEKVAQILDVFADSERFDAMPVNAFIDLWI
jgi:2-methylcitrate dehydratase